MDLWAADHPEAMRDPAGALSEVTGASAAECERAIEDTWLPEPAPDDPPWWWPREPLMRMIGAATALARPRTAVEVGVARGYTSAAILGALDAAGEGRLHSIDLPPRDEDAAEFVGSVVPDRLRERWHLELGPSRSVLPRLLPELGPVELFIHDGDHSYESQHEDLEAAWPHLAPGAIVFVDDVWTPAVFDFAASHGQQVLIATWAEGVDGVAVLRKGP